jgi:group I intron endonuclease
MTIGVYAVINKVTRKAYIGSSINVERRLASHKCYIKTLNFLHKQRYEEDARKYGVECFEFKILKITETEQEARELETAALECWIGDDLYNVAIDHTGGKAPRIKENYVIGAAKRNANPNYSKVLSAACKGKRKIVVCPYCYISGGGGNMRRYHFDNCKLKK